MKSIHCICLICIVIGFAAGPLTAREGDTDKAKVYFESNDYDNALLIWRSMAAEHPNQGLYFNIGLAESKLKHTASAIYAFEQALRIKPANKTYIAALKAERKHVENAVSPIDPFFLERWYLGIISIFRPGTWSLLGLVLFALVLLSWLNHLQAIRISRWIPQRTIKWMVLTGSVMMLISVLRYAQLTQRCEAVVMNPSELHQASTPESPILKSVSAGEKIRIKDQIGSWYYVALLNLDYGWIPVESCQIIRIE